MQKLLTLLESAHKHFVLMSQCDPTAHMWATVYLGYVEAMRQSVLLGGNLHATRELWSLLLDAQPDLLEDTEWAPEIDALLAE